MRIFRALIWRPSGGGTQEAGGTVAESVPWHALPGKQGPDSARAEGSSIVDELGECYSLIPSARESKA